MVKAYLTILVYILLAHKFFFIWKLNLIHLICHAPPPHPHEVGGLGSPCPCWIANCFYLTHSSLWSSCWLLSSLHYHSSTPKVDSNGGDLLRGDIKLFNISNSTNHWAISKVAEASKASSRITLCWIDLLLNKPNGRLGPWSAPWSGASNP